MTDLSIEKLYEFCLQQFAAESYLEDSSKLNDRQYLISRLRLGTNRTGYNNDDDPSLGSPDLNDGWPGLTRLTDPQISEFLAKFQVLHQWSDNPSTGSVPGVRPEPDSVNTGGLQLNGLDMLANTGFSATLIHNVETEEYTLAIRSTESREWSDGGDSERDLVATDQWGVAATGFALAQLDALESYYQWLKDNNFIPRGATLNVTGYSLGGHLATVFTEIHQNDPYLGEFGQTVTFNGAGRGTWNGSMGTEADFLAYYRQVLNDPLSADLNLDDVPPSSLGLAYAWAAGTGFLAEFLEGTDIPLEISSLTDIRDAAAAVDDLVFDDKSIYEDPRYGWAVIATMLKFGLAPQLPGTAHGTLADSEITQVYGYETINNLNMTANSQNNGPELRVGIESQPVIGGLAGQEINMAGHEFNLPGDYGFAHSIDLIADSLALQRALQKLDPAFTPDRMIEWLPYASAMDTQNVMAVNYEADALENILDALRATFLRPGFEETTFKEGAGGFGDWLSRQAFHGNLDALVRSDAFQALCGRVTIDLTDAEAGSGLQPRESFASLLALVNLSPVALKPLPGSEYFVDQILATEHPALFAKWQSDNAADQPEFFTDSWIGDRRRLIHWVAEVNEANVAAADGTFTLVTAGAPEGGVHYVDMAADEAVRVSRWELQPRAAGVNLHRIVFSADAADSLQGGAEEDRLYGLAGADTLEGKRDNDYLEGGEGIDTYVWNRGDGNDRVFEIDEAGNDTGGRLQINGAVITEVVRQSSGVYAAEGCIFLRIPAANGAELLVVRDSNGEGGLRVLNYDRETNDFGITWTDAPTAGASAAGAAAASSAALRPVYRDPLALDLDGDGIETVGVIDGNAVLFDHDGDGVRTGTGWVAPDDGWLVMDRNGNGAIDNGGELFGVDTVLQNGAHASDGFAALREWDANADGVVSASDAVFASLRIWRDLGQDGVAQAGELQGLAQAGILSIGVNGTPGTVNLGGGNLQTAAGSFTRIDGSSGSTVQLDSLAANLNLLTNTFYSDYADSVALTPEAAGLPDVAGSGRLRDLREAASLAPELQSVLLDYAAQTTRAAQLAGIDTVLTAWSATSDLGSLQQQFAALNAAGNPATLSYSLQGYAAGTAAQAEMLRRIGVVETFMGFTYTGNGVRTSAVAATAGNTTVSLMTVQLDAINRAYDLFRADIYGALLLETRLQPYVDAIGLQVTGDDLVADFSPVEALFEQAIARDARAGVTDLAEFVSAYGAGALQALGWSPLPYLAEQLALVPELAGFSERLCGGLLQVAAASSLNGSSTADLLMAAPQGGTLYGNAGADTLVGQAGRDVLHGGSGNDQLYGAGGADELRGGAGSNTYIYRVGEGSDHIYCDIAGGEAGSSLRLLGVTPAATSVSREGALLVFRFAGSADSLTVHDFFDVVANATDSGSYAEQGLGAVVFEDGSRWSLYDLMARVLTPATGGADRITGFFTDDYLAGLAGNDILDGGAGQDTLRGGDGDDTVKGGTEADALYGDAGHDTIQGGTGDDLLQGGTGNDVLLGNDGADTFVFAKGDGQDSIETLHSFNPLSFSDPKDYLGDRVLLGYAGGATSFRRDRGDLVIGFPNSSDTVTIKRYFDNDGASSAASIDIVSTDGLHYDYASVRTRVLQGGAGDETIVGFDAADSLSGGDGNDTLVGGGGDDRLDGGSGADVLAVDAGDDTYVFGAGSGRDKIEVVSGVDLGAGAGNDIIAMAGLTPGQVQVSRAGAERIVLKLNGSDDRITVAVASPNFASLTVAFADGTVWSAADLLLKAPLSEGADTLLLLDDNDTLHMLGGDDVVDAAGGNDTLYGDAGNDTLQGGPGDDQLYGNLGNDTLQGGDGSDTLEGNEDDDLLEGGSGLDYLYGGAGRDRVNGGDGNDWLGEAAADGMADILTGGSGNDQYGIFEAIDQLVELDGGGKDFVRLYFSGSWTLPAYVEDVALSWLGGSSQITGNAQDNYFDARYSTAADTLAGGLGNDTYYHVTRQDQVIEASGGGIDMVFVAADSYTLGQNIENATLIDAEGSGVYASTWSLSGNAGNNVLGSQAGFNTRLRGYGGDDTLNGGTHADSLYGDEGNDTLQGGAGDDYLYGGAGANTLFGGSGSDTLYAQGDNDVLYGGAGYDTLVLGAGFATGVVNSGDVYENLVAGSGRFALEFRDATRDDLYVSVNQGRLSIAHEAGGVVVMDSGSLSQLSQVTTRDGTMTAAEWFEWLRNTPGHYSGNVRIAGTGAESTPGARYTTERSGDDLLVGSLGPAGEPLGSFSLLDVTPMDTVSSYRIEPDGRLRVVGAGSGPVSVPIGNFTLQAGSALADDYSLLVDNEVPDWFSGGAASDSYSFGRQSGADSVDSVTPDGVRDVVMLQAGLTPADLHFARSQDDLVLRLDGAASLTLRQYFRNEDAAPAIGFADGGEVGRPAIYLGVYGATEGDDVIAGSNGDDILFGWDGDDALSGLDGADRLEGGAGVDRLQGGPGNDTYVLHDADTVIEELGEGYDTLESWVTLVLPAHVEVARLQGDAALNASGNDAQNHLYGNAAANRLDGGAGADVLAGGAGDDVYVVDDISDYVSEFAAGGSDSVETSLTCTLAENVENLTLTGTAAINGTGNNLDNVLRGNGAANVLAGGLGNDTYYLGAGDAVVEGSNAGLDTVVAETSLTLADNVENLRLAEQAAALLAGGNALANRLWGNSLDNTLNGAAGADVMEGGAGADVYVVDNVGDQVVEQGAQGFDTVQSSVTHTLSANVEQLLLTGKAAINGSGNAQDNTLTGNAAANVLRGGQGDDVYVVGSKDAVIEAAGEGRDTVQSAVAWTLGANLEDLILTGTARIAGTGNELDNRLQGNGAANVLKGGRGNDTYGVGSGDTVTEYAGDGIDTVESAIAWTLGSHLENLTLTGSGAVNATGNALANRLRGNAGNNVLNGGAGNDTYLFGRGGAADTLVDSDSSAGNADLLLLDAGIDHDQLWFRQVGNGLEISVIGSADQVTVSNWYGGAGNHVEKIQVADGLYLLDSRVEQLVQAMASMTPPPAGQSELTAAQHQQLDAVLAASWQAA